MLTEVEALQKLAELDLPPKKRAFAVREIQEVVVNPVDMDLFITYLTMWHLREKALARVKEEGAFIENARGTTRQHPALTFYEKQAKLLEKLTRALAISGIRMDDELQVQD